MPFCFSANLSPFEIVSIKICHCKEAESEIVDLYAKIYPYIFAGEMV